MFLLHRKSAPLYRRQPLRPAPVLVVQPLEDSVAYLLAKPNGPKWLIEATGSWQPSDGPPPEPNLWAAFCSTGIEQLSQRLGPLSGRKLLLCLRRPLIDFLSFSVAQIDGIDLTEQVHNQVALQERVDPDDWIIDYAVNPADPSGQRKSFVATLPREIWGPWESQLQAQKLKPVVAIPRIWAIKELLLDPTAADETPTLFLAIYRRQADLVVLDGPNPIFVRSLNLQQPDEPLEVAQQLLSEIRLTIGTIDLPDSADGAMRAVLVGQPDYTAAIADNLSEALDLTTSVVAVEQLPSFAWAANVEATADIAPLLGTLLAYAKTPDHTSIDLMNPKQIAKPVSRARLYGWLAAAALLGLGYWGFDLWQTYATTQQSMNEQAGKLKEARAALERTLPKARVADYLQRWESEQVDWLQQLAEITQRLPSGDDVVVRQYDGKRTATGADISMQIQVRDLEAIAAIDQAIRESGWRPQFRRVVETQDPAYPFRLESTISYTPEP